MSQKKRIGVIKFPGSNCDFDCEKVLENQLGTVAVGIWHTATELPQVDGLVIPGGFSYGDYLRAGALAAHSPIASAIKQFDADGGPIIGICNGFQILCEIGLLPGTLLVNTDRQFICRFVDLRVAEGASSFQQSLAGQKIRLPVAHGEGRYFIPQEGLSKLQEKNQIFARYHTASEGCVDYNPNGSIDDIAGIVNERGNVLGMMPHPERAISALIGGEDGIKIWEVFMQMTN